MYRTSRRSEVLRLAGLALAAAGLVSCRVAVNFDGTKFACNDGVCPEGQVCVQGFCEEPGSGAPDAAAAASPPLTDAGRIDPGADAAAADAAPVVLDAATVCNDAFGAATSYVLCDAQPQSCSFYVQTAGIDCNTECANLGGYTCIDGWDADSPDTCTLLSNDGCATTHNDQVCACDPTPPAA